MSSERRLAACARGATGLARCGQRRRASGASLLVGLALSSLSFAHAQPADAPSTTTRVENARLRFEDGLALARAGECERAVVEFEASIALAPRPNAYFNAARCEERLRRFTRALADYRAFVEMADAEDVARLRVASRVDALLRQIAVVRVEANVAAGVFIDDVRVADTPGELELDPGPIVIEVRADGYETARHTLVLNPAERAALLVTLGRTPMADVGATDGALADGERDVARAGTGEQDDSDARTERRDAEARSAALDEADSRDAVSGATGAGDGRARAYRRLRRGPFIAGVVMTGSALGVGAGFGIDALVLRRDGDRLDPYDANGREAARADVRRASQIADASFFAGVGFAVATTVIGVFTDFDASDDTPPLSVRPIITTASLGLAIDGRFR